MTKIKLLLPLFLFLIVGCGPSKESRITCPSCDKSIRKQWIQHYYYDDIKETHSKCYNCYYILSRKKMK